MNYRKYKKGIICLCVILIFFILTIVYIVNESFKNIINIIAVSFILAYILKPIQNSIHEKLKINKKNSAIIVIITLIITIGICVSILIPKATNMTENITKLINEINSTIKYINSKLQNMKLPVGNSFYYEVNEKINESIKELLNKFMQYAIYISSNLVSYSICPIIVYYFLSDGKRIFDHIMLIVPVSKRKICAKILNDIDKKLSMYIMSQFVLCFIIGILTFILLLMLKVKFPFLISIINAVFNIIPYFGPILGIVPAVISALIDSPIKSLYVVIGLIIIQQIEGNILSPKITGDSVDMHPFVIILLLLLGERIAGFLGMIIIIPIAVILKVIYDDINYYLF